MTRPTPDFPVLTKDTAPEASHALMDAYVARMGFVPNLVGILAASPAAAKTYGQAYAFLGETDFTPAEQQALLLTISRVNGCTYCVAAHTMGARKAGLDTETIQALRDGRPVLDPKLAALVEFAAKLVEQRGQVGRDAVNDFLTAGYKPAQIMDILVAAAAKTISNYMNHMAETPLDVQFADAAWHANGASQAAQ